MTRKRWKKPEAEAALTVISRIISERFGIEAPAVLPSEHRTGRDWEMKIDDMKVWTKAGRARMNVRMDAEFAHMYFQFDNPSRANDLIGRGDTSLNRHSGKWNEICTPERSVDLEIFTAQISSKFRRMAEKDPAPSEIMASEEADRVRDAHWAEMRAQMEASSSSPSSDDDMQP